MEPVMPEAPVDYIGEELRDSDIRRHNNRLIQLIHIPFVLCALENSSRPPLQWIDLTHSERIASVDYPRKINGSQGKQGGNSCHAPIQGKRFHFMQRMFQPVTEIMESFKRKVQGTTQHR